jgi:hypothetical protein
LEVFVGVNTRSKTRSATETNPLPTESSETLPTGANQLEEKEETDSEEDDSSDSETIYHPDDGLPHGYPEAQDQGKNAWKFPEGVAPPDRTMIAGKLEDTFSSASTKVYRKHSSKTM